jgi:hypothetical protein
MTQHPPGDLQPAHMAGDVGTATGQQLTFQVPGSAGPGGRPQANTAQAMGRAVGGMATGRTVSPDR